MITRDEGHAGVINPQGTLNEVVSRRLGYRRASDIPITTDPLGRYDRVRGRPVVHGWCAPSSTRD